MLCFGKHVIIAVLYSAPAYSFFFLVQFPIMHRIDYWYEHTTYGPYNAFSKALKSSISWFPTLTQLILFFWRLFKFLFSFILARGYHTSSAPELKAQFLRISFCLQSNLPFYQPDWRCFLFQKWQGSNSRHSSTQVLMIFHCASPRSYFRRFTHKYTDTEPWYRQISTPQIKAEMTALLNTKALFSYTQILTTVRRVTDASDFPPTAII